MEPKRKILPPVHLLWALAAIAAAHRYLPIVLLLETPHRYAGALPVVVGIAITATAAGAFRRAGTPVVPFERSTALVTGGLYRFTRNPMYLGMTLLLVGVAMLWGSLGAFLPIPLFVAVVTVRFIRGEERFLEDLFGDDYRAYKRRVRRWI